MLAVKSNLFSLRQWLISGGTQGHAVPLLILKGALPLLILKGARSAPTYCNQAVPAHALTEGTPCPYFPI